MAFNQKRTENVVFKGNIDKNEIFLRLGWQKETKRLRIETKLSKIT